MSLTERVNISMENSKIQVSTDKVLRLSVRGFTPPTKLSDLANDVGFVTNTVNDLVNYYTTNQIDTKLQDLRDTSIEVVENLPVEGKTGVLYMYKEGPKIYSQYFWNTNEWQLVGNGIVDLTQFYNKSEIDEKLKLVTNKIADTQHLGLIKSATDDVSADNSRVNVKVDPNTGLASVKMMKIRELPESATDVVNLINTNVVSIRGGDAKGEHI